MNVIFHPEAESEFYSAIDYYEEIEPELGIDFTGEALSAIHRAGSYPLAWSILVDDIRRCLVNRFPYGILFLVEDGNLYILAVMNLHREPGYWKDRIKNYHRRATND